MIINKTNISINHYLCYNYIEVFSLNKKLLNDQLLNYKLNLMLIHDTYSKNDQFINNKANLFVEKYNDYTKNKNKKMKIIFIINKEKTDIKKSNKFLKIYYRKYVYKL